MLGETSAPCASSEVLLHVEKISHEFAGLQALSNVSMRARRGEIIGLIGPNGSGKTTLFNLITGVYAARHGRIFFEGHDITGMPGHHIASAGIMRTFQNPRIFASLGLVEHLVIPMWAVSRPVSFIDLVRQMSMPWRSLAPAAEKILQSITALTSVDEIPASALSYGRRRLLELARCLASSPRLLLLDEPTAGLNPNEACEVHALLERLAASLGLAMIVIDHNVDFIERLCSRLVVLVNGCIIRDGPGEEVLRDPRVVAAYYGER